MRDLEITPISTKKSKLKLRKLMEDHTIPAFAESVLMVGASGSGKTTLLMNLMTKKQFYKDYFDFVFLFSTTGEIDDSFKILKLKKSHIYTTEEEMIEALEIIVTTQKGIIEDKGIVESPKICLIFEDLTSNLKLMKNKTFMLLWTAGRHLNLQVIACIHKYKALSRTQRLQAMNILYFRGAQSEVVQLADDFTPPGYSKKEFIQIIDYATSGKHNFLYIANKVPFKIRYRKNFDTILTLLEK